MKKVVPCNVCIKRFYRAYVTVDENADESEIIARMKANVLENQDEELTPDPDLDIEEQDLVFVKPDYEAEWEDDGEDVNPLPVLPKFGQVSWCEEDIVGMLDLHEIPVNDFNVRKLYDLCQHHQFLDGMVEAGWNYMETLIDAEKDWDMS